jgi:hypothetical protein
MLSIHLDLEFRLVLTVAIALAVGVAGWRHVWDTSRKGRSPGEDANDSASTDGETS